jgi:hypothetical protein
LVSTGIITVYLGEGVWTVRTDKAYLQNLKVVLKDCAG